MLYRKAVIVSAIIFVVLVITVKETEYAILSLLILALAITPFALLSIYMRKSRMALYIDRFINMLYGYIVRGVQQ
ncbi:hypothetical protein AGMMS50229_04500 [Campylobacterota bacterium]|nr:hypothetical protein AGMMS50229_04500 [Campylobacterota bacterium]